MILNAEDCLLALQEFNWICQEFSHAGWQQVYDRALWGPRGRLLLFRQDIDGDGAEDAIVKVEHVGTCSRGGPVCSHYFPFGDQPVTSHPHQYSVKGNGPLLFENREGIWGFYFHEPGSGVFYSVSDIRNRTLNAPLATIEVRLTGE